MGEDDMRVDGVMEVDDSLQRPLKGTAERKRLLDVLSASYIKKKMF